MTTFTSCAPKLAGLCIATPMNVEENLSLAEQFGEKAMIDIIRSTGIERRPVALTETIASLGTLSIKNLISKLNWDPESVDAVIVVTQTPDYPLPSTAILIQNAVGLKTSTIALDINLGCSGYVYGLSVINGLMQTAGLNRALLVCGDITSRMINPNDRGVRPLFGDAVAVTAIELAEGPSMTVDLGSDGSGAPYLISRTGGTIAAGLPQLFMDGVQVMAFSLKRVAPSIEAVLRHANCDIKDIDAVIFHQANAMMLKNLARKIGANDDQLILAIKDFGNTSSASIPLAIASCLMRPNDYKQDLRLLMSGFGVGWSWATALWKTTKPDVIEFINSP
jgi:3-oxoacyl-[acyl-carrier-protein] synthase III